MCQYYASLKEPATELGQQAAIVVDIYQFDMLKLLLDCESARGWADACCDTPASWLWQSFMQRPASEYRAQGCVNRHCL
jgi:hypothetical protein